MNTTGRTILALTAICSLLSGCAQLAYDVARESNIKACDKQTNLKERDTCRKQYVVPYDQYEQQRQDIAQRGTEKPMARKDESSLCFKRAATGEMVCPN